MNVEFVPSICVFVEEVEELARAPVLASDQTRYYRPPAALEMGNDFTYCNASTFARELQRTMLDERFARA